jgi:hypothetical protein
MRFDRLLAAAQAVEETPNPEKFTMETWRHVCGTPGCVLGQYAARTDLQDYVHCDDPDYQGKLLFIEDHFEISEEDWDELFGCEGCMNAATPEEAGRYIRDFVARHGGPVT